MRKGRVTVHSVRNFMPGAFKIQNPEIREGEGFWLCFRRDVCSILVEHVFNVRYSL